MTKIILINGSGSGKSQMAQLLNRELESRGIKTKWYDSHDNPLTIKKEEKYDFIKEYPRQINNFVKSVVTMDTVHVIESPFLNDTLQVMSEKSISYRDVETLFSRINSILKPLKPKVLSFKKKIPGSEKSEKESWSQNQAISEKLIRKISHNLFYSEEESCYSVVERVIEDPDCTHKRLDEIRSSIESDLYSQNLLF